MFSTSSVECRGGLLLALSLSLLLTATAFAVSAQEPAPAPRSQQPTPTSTPTPTPSPTPEQTPTPSPTPAETTTPAPTPAPTPTPTPAPTPTPTPAEVEEVERIESDLTNVLLSATDKQRRFVTTLRPEDLRLTEDGVEQQMASFERETDAPLSLALLVDTSASQEMVLKDEQEAASGFIRSVLRPGRDTAAVLSFTGVTRIDQPSTPDIAPLLAAVNALQVRYTERSPECQDDDAPQEVQLRCRTGVWDAVTISVREVLAKTPERTRRAIILLSDGDDTSSRVRLYQATEYAVRNNTVVYAIGIRDRKFGSGEMRRDFLNNLADQTGGRAFFPKRPEDLTAAFAQIEQEMRSQYFITYTSTNRARDNTFRRLRLEIINPALRKQNLRLLYRQGYYAKGNAER
jgi:Ca-activated chloride channel family protein